MTENLQQLLLFLVITLAPMPLAASVVLASGSGAPKHSISHFIFSLGLIWCIIEAVIALLLGILHHLELQFVIGCESFIAITGVLLWLRMKRINPCNPFAKSPSATEPLSRAEVLILGAIGFILIVQFCQLPMNPTLDYDSLSYHLPATASSYQTHSISIPSPSDSLQSCYPYNWEVMSTLFVMPFEDDLLIVLPGLIGWGLLGLAIYRLATISGAGRICSLTGSGLGMAMPLVVGHINSAHIDLPFAAFFMASLYFGILYVRTHNSANAAICAASIGMMFGLKSSAIAYVPAPIVLLCAGSIRRIPAIKPVKKKESKIGTYVITAAGTACCLLLGGYWIVRNYVNVGNPFGLMEMRIAGMLIFPGKVTAQQISSTTLAAQFNPLSPEHWQILGGAVYMALGAPIIAALVQIAWYGLRGRSRKSGTKGWLMLASGVAFTGLLYWLSPFGAFPEVQSGSLTTSFVARSFRYGFSAVGLLMVLGAVCATNNRTPKPVMVALTLASAALVTYGSRLLPLGLITLMGWALYQSVLKRRISFGPEIPRGKATILAGVPILFLAAPCMLGIARNNRAAERVIAYGGCSEYISRSIRPDEPIGYLFSHESYLFYGSDLSRRVIYASPQSRSRDQWVKMLRENGIKTIAIGPMIKVWQPCRELAWLNDPKGPFFRIYGGDINAGPVIYGIRE